MRTCFIALCLLATTGCSLKLPDIPANHPGSSTAPGGLVYATPAVLEVIPLARPADRPTTRPAHSHVHPAQGMTPRGEMPRSASHATSPGHEHGAQKQDGPQTMPAPTDKEAAQGHTPMSDTRQQQMMREGQLHE